ncbi:MAG: FAD binding domain-containing protein, partial [Pseudomonadota bacterium]|nr:FAD binding domain-containing protein [Pseudomonadota bacterium]
MRYEAPETLAAAVAFLGAAGGNARVLAGGTDLIIQIDNEMIEPDLLVDIKNIQEMRSIEQVDGGYRVGAAVIGMELMEHGEFRVAWPGVIDGVKLIGSIQVKGRATVGGNVCNASPAADSTPALIAAAATATVVGAGGSRDIPVEDICIGPGKTSLADDEFVVAFNFAKQPANYGSAYQRFTPRTEMDIAVVGVGIGLSLDDGGTCIAARVSLGAVAAKPLLVDEAAVT